MLAYRVTMYTLVSANQRFLLDKYSRARCALLPEANKVLRWTIPTERAVQLQRYLLLTDAKADDFGTE